jgi:hypothetical protein
MLEARCLCGDHVWRVEAPLQLLHHCHCTYCRKHQGTACATVGAVSPDAFAWLARGELIAFESSPGFERLSCARCGSPVPGRPGDLGLLFVFAGPLEGDPGTRPDGHIFTASKAPWFEIEDGLPGFDAYPPGFDAPVQPTPEPRDAPGSGVRGSCLCGAVRFAIEGESILARHCHCLRCRRARAALHASNWVVRQDALRFTHGADRVRSYRLPEARYFTQTFCADCGCPAPVVDAGRGIAIVPLGVLDDDPGVRPQEHIWVDSKAAWYELPGDLPRYPEGPPRPVTGR